MVDICEGGMGLGITLPRDDNEVKYGEKGEMRRLGRPETVN